MNRPDEPSPDKAASDSAGSEPTAKAAGKDGGGRKPKSEGINYGRVGLQLALLALSLAVGGGLIGYLAAGGKGLAGALLGAAIVGLFFGASALTMHLSPTPEAKARNLMVTWFGKLIILFVVMLALNQATFINRPALGLTILAGIIGSLVLEGRVVWSARVPPETSNKPS
ncbi:MAG: hypothetical protein LBG11_06175 [Bifidobacteriaceae bacterium]|jgi:hypothetical protein|nr:hypothetical protein [Bifidobacteriaceae bacterium]